MYSMKLGAGLRNATRMLSLAAVGLSALATSAQAQIFQDNMIGYRYGTQFKEPGVAGGADIEKSIVSYTHVSGDKWGGNFFNLDVLFSDGRDPSVAVNVGAQELYGLYRRTFSYNKVTGAKGGYGLIADFGLQLGADFNAKNTLFGSEKKLALAGPYIAWAVPVGFLTTALEACHEWNQNGFAKTATNFNTTFCFEMAWAFPFKIAHADFKFSGFFNIVAPKGPGATGLSETKTEILTRPEISLDVGSLFGGKKNFVEVGVAYEYWLNKFGNDNALLVGSIARTPMLTTRIHF